MDCSSSRGTALAASIGFQRITAGRVYGSFYRTIPLPEGTLTDQAKASFKDGVLEVTAPAPPGQVSRGRRLDISRGEERGQSRERGGRAAGYFEVMV